MKYTTRDLRILSPKKAQIVGETLQKISKNNNNQLKTVDVVNYAKPKNSELHDFFEWDNTKAGHKYRLQQARHLISCVVEVRYIDNKKKEFKSFHNIKTKNKENVYVTIEKLSKNRDYFNQLLRQCQQQINYLSSIIDQIIEYRDKK